jgi:hypothetical protein
VPNLVNIGQRVQKFEKEDKKARNESKIIQKGSCSSVYDRRQKAKDDSTLE